MSNNTTEYNYEYQESCPCESGFTNCDCDDYFDSDVCEGCGEEICACWQDYCCWHPMYAMCGGPKNYCACKEHAEQLEYQQSIEYKVNRLLGHLFHRIEKRFKWFLGLFKSDNKRVSDIDDLPF